MDRDEAAMLLVVLLSGALMWLVGGLTPASPSADEATAWRRLWLPAIPASIPFFTLLGFAVADHEGPQSLGLTRLLAMVPFGLVWIRAAVRAVRAAFAPGRGPAIATGLFRPRIELSTELRASLDPGELRAVMAHEQAHVRHRDPLRIWLAQIVTDLQWPLSRPRGRQRIWTRALELARDEEAARQPGVDAADLASAILKAARLAQHPAQAVASLTNDEAFLEARVRRLLAPAGDPRRSRRSFLMPLAVCLAVAAFTFGMAAAGPVVATLAGNP